MKNMLANEKAIIDLIGVALGRKAAEPSPDCSLPQVLGIGNRYKLIPLIFYGIERSGIPLTDTQTEAVQNVLFDHTAVDQVQTYEIGLLMDLLSQNGIDHMPLKGIVLKALYPNPEMRPMSDGDILIRESQKEQVIELLKKNGFNFQKETHHEIVFDKNDVLIELHKCLIPPYNPDYYAYFEDGWKFAQKIAPDAFRYEMSPDDQFVYLFTHFAKHYRDGGVGPIHLVDFFILCSRFELDETYITENLNKLHLADFYQNIVKTLRVWFEGEPSDEMTDFLTDRLFSYGNWGTVKTQALAQAVKDSKSSSTESIGFKRFLSLLFPSVDYLKYRYPVLQKHKWLLPAAWIARWFETVFFRQRNIEQQKYALKQTTQENVDLYQDELQYVGLDYNLE